MARLEHYAPEVANNLAAVALRDVTLNDEAGCWLIDDYNVEKAQHTIMLASLARLDMGGEVLNDLFKKDSLRVCDDQACLNPRHYDVTHRVKNRDRLLATEPRFYETRLDGSLLPLWEKDVPEPFLLPSIDESVYALRALQKRCVPHVQDPKNAPLSPNAISKITIDDTTGCWITRTYYVKPASFDKSFMFDGYGRLSYGPALKSVGYPVGPRMAHRVVWAAVGRELTPGKVLNHECGFHPCCNPDHMSQVTSRDNNNHARRMTAAIREMIE